MEVTTQSVKETQKLAAELIKKIVKKKVKGALVLGLVGELGSGKTTFIQGIAKGLKVRERVLSPTFVIMRKFRIGNKELRIKNLYHIDCYRIDKPKEILELGFKKIIKDPKNSVVIEWAEKIKSILPNNTVWLKFEHLGQNKRKIKIIKHKTCNT